MTESVSIGSATLYCGDCREIIPNLAKVGAVITDPVWPNCPPGLLQGSDDPFGLLSGALSAVKAERIVLVMRSDSDPRFLNAVPARHPFICLQALPYAVPMYLGRVLGGTEIAYAFGEPAPSRPGRRVIPMWGPKVQPAGRRKTGHPCSRSIDHQKWLVSWWSGEDETVLDPFMGGGTAGEACALLGRPFIGIELEPRYFDLACRQIDDALKQSDLFFDAQEEKLPVRQADLILGRDWSPDAGPALVCGDAP